eukprot:7849280-Pyramimonas_sp.AAC.1
MKVLTGGVPVKGVVKGAKNVAPARKRPAAAVLERPAAAATKANVGPFEVPFPGDPAKKIAEETLA